VVVYRDKERSDAEEDKKGVVRSENKKKRRDYALRNDGRAGTGLYAMEIGLSGMRKGV